MKTGPVAVKLLHGDAARQDSALDLAAWEFDMGRRVNSEFTAGPVGFGPSPGGAYLVTRLMPRFGPLSRARRGTFTASQLWRTAAAIARAIAAAHACGVIHCDIKPANLLVYGDRVRLIDFGIARLAADQPAATPYVHFSRGWAAPEQMLPDPLTPAVDVFAWGCVMTSMATGSGPFRAGKDRDWPRRVRHQAPRVSGLPRALEHLVRAALAPEAADRPSADELASGCDVPQRIPTPGTPRARFDERRVPAAA